MKEGRSLKALAQEIERQRKAKLDLLVGTDLMVMDIAPEPKRKLRVVKDGPKPGEPRMVVAGGTKDERVFGVTDTGHAQIAEAAGIPKSYYDRMRAEAPELLTNNINEWFAKYPAPRLLRTLDGNVRALRSDSYRPLEHSDLAEAVLPVLSDLDLLIMSCEITEKRLFIKAVDRKIERDVPVGHSIGDGSHKFFHTVCPAVIISNSEIGYGQLSVEAGIFTEVCTNLATIAGGAGMKRRHIGQRQNFFDGESIREMLADDTKRAADQAIWMMVRDVVKASFEEARFDVHVDRLKGLTELKLAKGADPVKVVNLSARSFGLNESETASVLTHLIQGADLSAYGLMNAVTRAAQDVPSYDRASELEMIGGDFLNLNANQWREWQKAA